MKSVVLGGGCFWGVEELVRSIDGVINTEVGYAGGEIVNPTYELVKTGRTGHAEVVKIDYDESKISLAKLLELFFQLHDPTTVNQQGNDIGTQYRSIIFYSSVEERVVAEEVIAKVNNSGKWSQPVVTELKSTQVFYSAESYHQDYLKKNPNGYTCHYWRS